VSEERELQRAGRRSYRIAGQPKWPSSSTLTSVGHIEDMVEGYALGALEPEETAYVESHVRGCPGCERALADAQRTVSMLPFLVPLHAPPIDAKVALFSRVSHAQKAAVAASLPSTNLDAFRTPTLPVSTITGDLVMPVAAGTGAKSAVPERSTRSGWLISVVSVPLLIALVATGFWGLQLQNQLTSQNSQLAELQSELTNFGSGTTTYQLSPGSAAPQAEGQIVMGSDQRQGMLQIDVNTDDGPKDFELLVNVDGQLVPAANVTVNQDGQGQARFELDQPFSDYESVQINAKPADTTVAPSGIDTLFLDNSGSLGSTGSGLDIGP
jgi:hypothetical protein